jgi:hypothetical protein
VCMYLCMSVLINALAASAFALLRGLCNVVGYYPYMHVVLAHVIFLLHLSSADPKIQTGT